MKESHSEGPASHADPESCPVEGNRGGEALTGARTGPVLSRENAAPSTRRALLGADALTDGGTLEANLRDLSERLKRGAYRAKPVRRAYILKADGRQRPLGVPTPSPYSDTIQ